MGLAVGVVAGASAVLLAAPMRGADVRASLRSRADGALDRGLMLLEEGRRAFRTRRAAMSGAAASSVAIDPTPLSATLGEIAQMHDGGSLSAREAQS
jgi:hypothetical protein